MIPVDLIAKNIVSAANKMIKRGNLQTKAVKFLILDKSNEGEMLSKGFKDEIYEAYRYDVQVCYISVTFTQEILEMINKFMMDPEIILVKRDELILDSYD